MVRAAALVLALLAAATEAQASQAQAIARIERHATFVAAASFCQAIGYEVRTEALENVEATAKQAAIATGMSSDEAEAAVTAAMRRQIGLLRSTFDKSIEQIRNSDGRFRPRLEALFDRYVPRCAEAAADPVFGAAIAIPPPAKAAEMRRDFIDELVAPSGEASWQTPRIYARGEYLFAVGACQAHLTEAEVKRATDGFVDASALSPSKVAAYYDRQLTDGITSAAELDLGAAQCAKILAGRRAKLGPKG